MKLAVALLSVAGSLATTPICLPSVHSTFAHVTSDVVHEEHHRQREYREGDHMMLWIDGDAQKSLVHVHKDHHMKEPAEGVLIDYAKGLEWRWKWENKKVMHCTLMKEAKEMKPICLSNGNMTGTATLGEHFKVDNYNEFVIVKDKGLKMDIDTVVESGSTSVPIHQTIVGMVEGKEGPEAFFHDSIMWVNFSEEPIDAKHWDVPSECPL